MMSILKKNKNSKGLDHSPTSLDNDVAEIRMRKTLMAEESKLKLYGMCGSSYITRVELALKLKGISYEYVEEDLLNKSQLFLQHNPVNKKVHLLVHHGKPIVEFLFILEYIDETLPNDPKLLPGDSYQRAKVRLWASFIQQV
ncbi:hypothetical protein CRYUN_Cryun12cG0149600 [Craigia yunnanensis]